MKKRKRETSFVTKLAAGIVSKRRILGIIFLALMIFSAFSSGWVELQEDLIQFLPDDAESKIALNLMGEELTIYGYGQAVIEDVSLNEAYKLQKRIEELDCVREAHFTPETEYKDHSALIDVYFNVPDGTPESRAAMEELREALSDCESYIFYNDNNAIADMITQQMGIVIAIFAVIILGVLLLTSHTYGEVLVLAGTFGAAALINIGTHFIFGTISIVSSAVSVVLQLALSMDYAIILCNRYKEERTVNEPRKALVIALKESIPAILASSLTTVAGLFSMTLMKFRLGYDLGVVLIKSIVISLASVFLFMPCLLSMFDGLMLRTKHKSFLPDTSFIGRFACRSRFVMPVVFLIALAAGCILTGQTKYSYNYVYTPAANEAESDYALRMISTRFEENQFMVLVKAGDYEAEKALIEDIKGFPEVTEVIGLASEEVFDGVYLCDRVNYEKVAEIAELDELTGKAIFAYYAAENGDHRALEGDLIDYEVPLIDVFLFLHDKCTDGELTQKADFEISPEQLDMINELYAELKVGSDQLRGENYSCIEVLAQLPPQGPEIDDFADRIHTKASQYYEDSALIYGFSMLFKDFETSFKTDNITVSLLSIVFVLVILFLTFKSVAMPILLILIIQGSIWINFGIPVLRDNYVYFGVYLIVSAIQMGSNVDYAIVMSTRYRELRGKVNRRSAIITAVNRAFPTVITSGLMMICAGFTINRIVSENITAGIGHYICVGTLITMILVLFVLPQILILGDGIVEATTLRKAKRSAASAKHMKRKQRSFVAGLLAVASAAMLWVAPVGLIRAERQYASAVEETEDLIKRADELNELAHEVARKEEENANVSLDFAEEYLTDVIGTEQLEAGIEEYDTGAATIEEYKKLLAEGEEEYRAGLEEYEKGLAEYEAGKAQVYSGQVEYDAGLAEYEAGKAQVAQGQAEYDAALAQYEAGRAQLEAGQALLNSVQPLYSTAMSLYDSYLAAQANYEARAAAGASVIELAILGAEVAAAQALFEGGLGGYSLSGLLSEIGSAQAEIDAGQAQLAAAEGQLAAGKAELDAGYAQLAEAEAQLAAGRAELDAGYSQLAAGQKQLEEAKAQLDAAKKELEEGKRQIAEGEKELAAGKAELDAGIETVRENREKLQSSLDTLDMLSDEKERIAAGVEMMLSNKDIAAKAGKDLSDAEIFTVAGEYFEDQLKVLEDQTSFMILVSYVLIISAAAALIAVLFYILRLNKLSAFMAALAMILAAAGALAWKFGCTGYHQLAFYIAAIMALLAGLASNSSLNKIRY